MAKTSGELEKERVRYKNQIIINDFDTCYYCKSNGLKEIDTFCPNCSFPQRGKQEDMKKFIWNIKNKEKLLADKQKALNIVRNILYFFALLKCINALVLDLMINVNFPAFLFSIIEAGIYFSLGLWSRKQPFLAILTGVNLYIIYNVILALSDPNTISQSLFIKFISC